MAELNFNNNNNRQGLSHGVRNPDHSVTSLLPYYGDILEDIQPENTAEGYGLRTPYGTHLSLDFLKYCQELGKGSSISANNAWPKSGSTEHNDALDASSHLVETRRRLDAFRSFRVKRKGKNDLPRSSKTDDGSHHSGDSSSNAKDTGKYEADVFKWIDSPKPQHNLHIVRDQMAMALTRLRHLEDEVKQIPILHVKLSVLQQEKQRLQSELELCKVGQTDLRKRQYTSIDIRSNCNLAENVSAAPKRPEEARCIKVATEVKHGADQPQPEVQEPCNEHSTKCSDASVDKCVSTENAHLRHTATTTLDLVNYNECACGNDEPMFYCDTAGDTKEISFEVADAGVGDSEPRHYVDASSNVPHVEFVGSCVSTQDYKDPSTFADFGVGDSELCFSVDASTCIPQKEFKDCAVCTEVIETGPKCVNAAVGECAIYFSVDASTSVPVKEFKHHSTNTESAILIDRCCACQPDNKDFQCCVDIRVLMSTIATDSSDLIELVESFTNTEAVVKAHAAVQHRNPSSDMCIDAHITPPVKHVSTVTDSKEVRDGFMNTKTDLYVNKSCDSTVQVADFACNVNLVPGMLSVGKSMDVIPATSMDGTADSNRLVQKGTIMHTSLSEVCKEAEMSVVADAMVVRDAVIEHVKEMTPKKCCSIHQCPRAEKKCAVDVMTDTRDLLEEAAGLNTLKSEIGEYVGQVEILLEEQQSLLADKYKELESVLEHKDFKDDSEAPLEAIMHTTCEFKAVKKSTEVTENPPSESFVLGVKLRENLQSACLAVCNYLKNPDLATDIAFERSMTLLREEWFLLATRPESRPESIIGFVQEVGAMSPLLLSKVVNTMDSSGNTALHYVISHRNFHMVCALVDLDELDVDLFNNAGFTASMLASITKVNNKIEEQAIALLFARADINLHAMHAGQTALMLAVSHGCSTTSRLLLSAGADINAQDEDGSTALMCATEHRHADLVKLLLSYPRCDPNIADNDGSTAMNIAVETAQRSLVIFLYSRLKLCRPLNGS